MFKDVAGFMAVAGGLFCPASVCRDFDAKPAITHLK
jgi:hypothetical protein